MATDTFNARQGAHRVDSYGLSCELARVVNTKPSGDIGTSRTVGKATTPGYEEGGQQAIPGAVED